MDSMACFSHFGVVEVLGAVDVLRGVPGGDEDLEVSDAFTRVTTGIAGIVCVGFLLWDLASVQTAGNLRFTGFATSSSKRALALPVQQTWWPKRRPPESTLNIGICTCKYVNKKIVG